MPRPSLYTRSKTAPQLPPLSDISPISPISLPFTDPFSLNSKISHHQHQNQNQSQSQNLTHNLRRSTSCSPSPQPQKRLSWPLRRASLASLATKSLPSLPLPLPTLRPTHVLQRLRSSFSSFLVTKHNEHTHRQGKEREEGGEDDAWGREWEVGYESRRADGEREEEDFARGFCLHLPPEVSMDRSEIEYLRRLEREALSARGVGVMA